MLELDGSFGEGGGQILRSSLALSMLTGTPFRITKIRAGRSRPGLLRQHLAGVRAAKEVSRATVEGDDAGSQTLTFSPNKVSAGTFRYSIGSAGSATLVLQTILPALLWADAPSTIEIEGGTHNSAAPPFDFLDRTFRPVLERMGPKLSLTLERHGFYPAGGGRIRAVVRPAALEALELLSAGPVSAVRAKAIVAALPGSIARRELTVLCDRLKIDRDATETLLLEDSDGPGNALHVDVVRDELTEVFSAFGEKGVPSERVAEDVAKEALGFIAAEVPVGPHLADQLVLLLAIGKGGAFRTVAPTEHLRTQIAVLEKFLSRSISLKEEARNRWLVEVK